MSSKNIPEIDVKSAVAVVPIEKTQSYYWDEIACEGSYRKNVKPIILYPHGDTSTVNKKWIYTIFKQMEKVRMNESPKEIDFGDGFKIDVGLVDIQVFFSSQNFDLFKIYKKNPEFFFNANIEHFDIVVKGAFHDQMILISALHCFDTSGDICIHYHNVIFSLRKQGNIIGVLDIENFLSKLSEGSYISIVA